MRGAYDYQIQNTPTITNSFSSNLESLQNLSISMTGSSSKHQIGLTLIRILFDSWYKQLIQGKGLYFNH